MFQVWTLSKLSPAAVPRFVGEFEATFGAVVDVSGWPGWMALPHPLALPGFFPAAMQCVPHNP
jgi:hypothetical protein